MKLSVIIPTLNEEQRIEALLKHLSNCPNFENCEIIVVDAGSQDKTCAIVSKFNVLLKTEVKRSRAIQMNQGAEMSNGDVLYFVHADTEPPMTFYSDIKNSLEKGYHLGSYSFQFDSKKKLLAVNSWFTKFNGLQFRGGDQTIFCDRRSFDSIHGFNEQFCIMEEYDFLKRAKKNGLKFNLMKGSVKVSDRKYDHNSYLRVNLANAIAFTMFRFNCSPQKIKDKYHSILKHPKDELC